MAYYTKTVTQPLNQQAFSLSHTKSGFSGRFFVNNSLHLDHDPKEDEWSNHWDPKDEGPVEIHDPEPESKETEDHTHYDMKSQQYSLTPRKRKQKKVVYHCEDYIEVPGGTDSVTYTDEDGNQYEVSIDDLQYYDGDDGEIQYTKGKKRIPKMYLGTLMQQARLSQRYHVR